MKAVQIIHTSVLEGHLFCVFEAKCVSAVTFSRIDPEGKLVMGFRKASSNSNEQVG